MKRYYLFSVPVLRPLRWPPLVKALQRDTEHFETKVCVTAQHRQMLDQVLEVFDIIPDYDLNIMAPNQDLYDITTKVLLGLRDVLKDFCPDTVLVHGDTTTSMVLHWLHSIGRLPWDMLRPVCVPMICCLPGRKR